jgi:hypothetical protein
MTDWVSKHTFVTPYEHKKTSYVDAAGIGGRKKLLPGEVLKLKRFKKSAEAIVGKHGMNRKTSCGGRANRTFRAVLHQRCKLKG